jgi:UV DNA damage endonuclease
MFATAIKYCSDNGIKMYRVTSHLFPFYESTVGADILDHLTDKLLDVGNLARALDIRVVMHPDQWVVLSSDTKEVVERSIQELQHHARVFDDMGLSQTHYNLLNIHGGKRDRLNNLIKVINDLPTNVKSRLTLENDENCYSVRELYKVHELTNIPILFDFHHSIINNKLCSYDHKKITEEYQVAASTWSQHSNVTTHISNGAADLLDSKHSDYIVRYPELLLTVPWVEVEARKKELALVQLKQSLENYYGHDHTNN